MGEDKLYGEIIPVDESKLTAPVLLVVIDTEEEFDWSKPHSRTSVGVAALQEIYKVQDIFNAKAVIPCYVMDYPIVTQHDGTAPIKEIYQNQQCSLGAHLHPWVNPPHDEEVTLFNSFPGNLPKELEYRKLSLLVDQIEKVFGSRPKIYKAGRYGIGQNTARTLESLGLTIDLSPTPGFDYSGEGGPDYSNYTNKPFMFGPDTSLLSVPCTSGYIGYLGGMSRTVYEFANKPPYMKLRLPGILSRIGAVDRLRLSPEGYELKEMIALSDYLVKRGCKILTLSFHSPSVKPGCTPYVRSQSDLAGFLSKIENYIDYFFSKYSGQSMTPEGLYGVLHPYS
jgi:hypothetical protein